MNTKILHNQYYGSLWPNNLTHTARAFAAILLDTRRVYTVFTCWFARCFVNRRTMHMCYHAQLLLPRLYTDNTPILEIVESHSTYLISNVSDICLRFVKIRVQNEIWYMHSPKKSFVCPRVLMMSICNNELCHHWSRQCFVTYSSPSLHTKHRWLHFIQTHRTLCETKLKSETNKKWRKNM